MSRSRFGWIEEYETFGWLIVVGMSEAEVVARLGGGAAVELAAADAWEWDGPTFGVRSVDGRVLLWDDADLGLDARVPLWLSESGRCVAVAWGMNSSSLTVAEEGRLVRRFDPMLRGPVGDGEELYDDEADAEADRDGDPLAAEAEVDWAASTSAASLHLVELLTGVSVETDPWDDPRMRWFGVPVLPPEPAAPLPPLHAALQAAPPDRRDAALRAGLLMAADIAGLAGQPSFQRALDAAAEVAALADPPGTPSPRDDIGEIEAFRGDNARRRDAVRAALDQLQLDWEFPLGQRIDPVLYPGDGPWPPPKSDRHVPTTEESAELALAQASSSFLVQSGLEAYDDHAVHQVLHGIRTAAGDRWTAVEPVMIGELS
jgi:hypothetical protein